MRDAVVHLVETDRSEATAFVRMHGCQVADCRDDSRGCCAAPLQLAYRRLHQTRPDAALPAVGRDRGREHFGAGRVVVTVEAVAERFPRPIGAPE